MAKRNLNKLGLFTALLLFASCDCSKVFDLYQDIDSSGWSSAETLDFEVEIDAQEGVLFNYLIGLRNNNDYLYANMFFFVGLERRHNE
jgi:gliding motility-associated lipoprotein GldH